MRGEYSTKQRDAILAFLKENSAHVTASDIIFHLREQGYKLSLATVYRTLEKFEKDGFVKKLIIGNGNGSCYQYIDGNECNEHFHLKCIKCGRLIHLSCEFLHTMQSHIFSDHGFIVSSGRTIIHGTCADCSALPNDSCHSHHCHCDKNN
ncbi:MAG: transcriptional repressor [Clostridia bacterium]|nr:transcriptional repressor [Clostridia bacterium]